MLSEHAFVHQGELLSDEPSRTRLWQCPNCGQVLFSDQPPDMCDFCRDFTTWRLIAEADVDPERIEVLIKRRQYRPQQKD
ncbi:MAG: hypothetical protein OHK0046_21090 [Anaerolineae bacterium]